MIDEVQKLPGALYIIISIYMGFLTNFLLQSHLFT